MLVQGKIMLIYCPNTTLSMYESATCFGYLYTRRQAEYRNINKKKVKYSAIKLYGRVLVL